MARQSDKIITRRTSSATTAAAKATIPTKAAPTAAATAATTKAAAAATEAAATAWGARLCVQVNLQPAPSRLTAVQLSGCFLHINTQPTTQPCLLGRHKSYAQHTFLEKSTVHHAEAAYLAVRAGELDEGNAFQGASLPVGRQPNRVDGSALLESLCQLLADIIFPKVAAEPLHENGCRVAVVAVLGACMQSLTCQPKAYLALQVTQWCRGLGGLKVYAGTTYLTHRLLTTSCSPQGVLGLTTI